MPHPWCQHRKTFPRNPIIDTLRFQYSTTPRTCRPRRPARKFPSIKSSLWQDIVNEDREIEAYLKRQKKENIPKFNYAAGYVKRNLFPGLIPAFEKMCRVTLRRGILDTPVRFFSFFDGLAEILYNKNPVHPERSADWVSVHRIFKNEKRPFYPYHWFLTPDEAATIIQKRIRGFLTRRKYNLVEMKEERRKILEGIEKQQKCFNALRQHIEEIYAYES